jgi:photosystem II stability/assembly factor-like uncharacterized protein
MGKRRPFIVDSPQRRQKGTSTHLKRVGGVSSEIRLAAIRQSSQITAPPSRQLPEEEEYYNWLQLGPTCIPSGQTDTYDRVLVSGRITSIVVHPTNPDILYVATAQGGIWKTKDGGRNWQAKSDEQVSLAIGALAIDPQHPDVLYAGTGEGNLMGAYSKYAASYYGCGLLKTEDGGDNWKPPPEAHEIHNQSPFKGSRFFRIAVNPKETNIIFVATSFGVYRSKDKGSTWTPMTDGLPKKEDMKAASDIIIDPNYREIVYAAFWGYGIYKTKNANEENPKWEALVDKDSDFPPTNPGRIVLDVSKSDSLTIYAFITNGEGTSYFFYVSTNGGSKWTNIGLPTTTDTRIRSLGIAGNYNLIIAVDYNDPNIVYLGATPLLKAILNPRSGRWRFIDIGRNIHVDNHAFAFHPTDSNIIFTGNDGGIAKSNDGGATWDDTLNEGLCITQFEFMDQHPNSDAVMLAGTQDNGTLQFRNNSVFYLCAENDGGFCAIDPKKPSIVYHTYAYCTPFRSEEGGEFGEYENGGSWMPLAQDGNKVDQNKINNFFNYTGDNKVFYPPFVLDQTCSSNLALGTRGIFLYKQEESNRRVETKSIEDKWENIFWIADPTLLEGGRKFLKLAEGHISAINYVNSNLIYAGTTKGEIFLIKKVNNNWTTIKINPEIKNGNSINFWPNSDNPMPINDIATFPENNTVIVVAFGGISKAKIAMLWRGQISDNGLIEWSHISGNSGNTSDPPTLPTIPVNTIVIEPNHPKTMYIGTDIGVFRTKDEGKSWDKFGKRLPNCSVLDMRLLLYKNEQTPFRLLRAVTHGRGLWEVELDKRTNKHDVDLYVRDHIMDTGRFVPSSSGNEKSPFQDPLRNIVYNDKANLTFEEFDYLFWWMCADIKVDTPFYQIDIDEVDYVKFEYRIRSMNLKEGCKNRVYVQVHNRGIKDAGDVTIKLLWAKVLNSGSEDKSRSKEPNLPDIPQNFWNDSADLGLWKQIGIKFLPEPLPDQKIKTLTNAEPTILCWEWNIPIDKSGQIDSQIGLLVVIDSPEDPIPEQNKRIFDIKNLVRNEKHIGIRVLKVEK